MPSPREAFYGALWDSQYDAVHGPPLEGMDLDRALAAAVREAGAECDSLAQLLGEAIEREKALEAENARLREALDAIPSHAVCSWTYVPAERSREALLRIRRLVKDAANYGWSPADESDWLAVFGVAGEAEDHDR